jgi:hypothetical protein
MSKKTIIDKINELGEGVADNASAINTAINTLKWNYVEETMSDHTTKKWDWVEPNTIYDIKMLIPSSLDTRNYAAQGVWDTEGTVIFSFSGSSGIPGDGGALLRASLVLDKEGFYNVYGVGEDNSTHYPKGDWTLKIWYRKLLTV